MASRSSSRIQIFSERLYRAMLILYPRSFRRIYAQEMLQTFRDCSRERSGDLSQQFQWWGLVLHDLFITASSEHLRYWHVKLKRLLGMEKEYTMLDHLLNLDIALRTDIGRKRAINEDKMASIVPEDPQIRAKKGALFIVADGMGGHTQGERASEIAVEEVRNTYYQQEGEDIAAALVQAIQSANQAIFQESEQRGTQEKMGSTCIAAVLHNGTAYIGNVGDSRCYIINQGLVRQVTHDHSIVADLVRDGKLTEEEARTHPERNIITRCLGTRGEVEVDVFTEAIHEGDILVFCTDGLSALVRAEEVRDIVEQYNPKESVIRLIEQANERGGTDNITAIVARIGQAA